MAKVSFTRNLYRFFPTLPTAGVEIDANSVAELVNELDRIFGGLGSYLRDDAGRVRKHISIYVDEELVRDPVGLTDPLTSSSSVFVAQALSRG